MRNYLLSVQSLKEDFRFSFIGVFLFLFTLLYFNFNSLVFITFIRVSLLEYLCWSYFIYTSPLISSPNIYRAKELFPCAFPISYKKFPLAPNFHFVRIKNGNLHSSKLLQSARIRIFSGAGDFVQKNQIWIFVQ